MKLALIGHPVAHSRSPGIHQQFASQFARDISFELIDADEAQLSNQIDAFFAAGGNGMNVTLPHKAAVLALCSQLGEDAQLAGAANTLVPDAQGLRGENTDGRGLIRDLQRLGIPLQGQRILVIGAGGAARGIIKPLLDAQPSELVWSNRNPLKLEGQDEAYRQHGPLSLCANLALKGDQFDLILHATAAGHHGLVPRLPDGLFRPGGVAYDLSYGPAAEPFLNWAKLQGAEVQHAGLGMLIEQAALAWQHWTGELPRTDAVHASLTL